MARGLNADNFILEKSDVMLNEKGVFLSTIIMVSLRGNRILRKSWRGYIIGPERKYPGQKTWHGRNKAH